MIRWLLDRLCPASALRWGDDALASDDDWGWPT